MKTSQVAIVILVIVGILALVWSAKKKDAVNTPPASQKTASIKGCYVARITNDVYTLNIKSQEQDAVSGTLAFKNYQKDSSSGTFVGTYKNGILLGDYSFQSEGTSSLVQVVFKQSGTNFIRGYGDMNADGTRFADLANITYDASSPLSVFKNEACPTT